MSFKDEVTDAIVHVVSLRQLIQLSRPRRLGEKYDEEKEKTRAESIADSKKKIEDLPAEKVENVIALAVQSTPIEIDEIVHKLERLEFLLEDMNKGKDKRANLSFLIGSFRVNTIIYGALSSITSLQKIITGT
ncbi:MAG TPA: hypothetical protein VN739_10255 [Nitrososphaerales archaeon]|nr:hypothetical protein [Nitrososphaerales archaeon]